MGIRVECPHGHKFKVKDKYAGKRGLCPHCKGQVVVKVPTQSIEDIASEAVNEAYRDAVISENRAAHAAPPPAATSSSVFDDDPLEQDASTSASLLGSSVIRHNVKCKCGVKVPMWYARCPSCGEYLERR